MPPLNGTELINDPWGTIFSPWTNLFENVVGNGGVFYLFPLSVLAFALYTKTQNTLMPSMFIMASGALLAGGNIFIGATSIAAVYIIFTAIGITGLFISLFFQKGG